MHRLVLFTLCGSLGLLYSPSALAQRTEIYGQRQGVQLGAAAPRGFTSGFGGRLATFDGWIGGRFQPVDGDYYAAYFNTLTNQLEVLEEWPISAVEDINDNGLMVAMTSGFGGFDDIPAAVLLIDPVAAAWEIVRSGDGIYQTPRINERNEVAFYSYQTGVWVWPQMVNLPIGEGFDPLLIELGLIEAELGLVTVNAFSNEGWVTGSISSPGSSEPYAFMWNFQTDQLFRLDDPEFEGLATQATVTSPEGWSYVETHQGGRRVVYRWDGITLEPLGPRHPFANRAPLVDLNASGEAVGGNSRINDEGQTVSIRQGPRVELWRGDPLNVEGDYNASGMVDQGDLDLALLHWGGDALPDDWYHDFPDLPIDQAELDTVLLRWGLSDGTPALTVQASVPEPSVLMLMLLLTSAVALRVRSSDRLLNSDS